jgi:hypothetical protein
MGANRRRIREDKEQPAEHAERRRKRNSCQGGHSVSVLIRVHPWSIPFFAPAGRNRGQRSARRRINSRANRGMAWFKRVHRPNAPICGLSKNKPPSTDEHKYDDVRCVMFGLGLGARRAHPPSGAATDEQRRPRPNTTQPFGRQSFLPQASLLAPHRPMKGMLVARVSPAPKIPCREHHRIDVHQYLATAATIRQQLHYASKCFTTDFTDGHGYQDRVLQK